MRVNESIVEDVSLTWFGELGYSIGHSPQIVTLRNMLLAKLLIGKLSVVDGQVAHEEGTCRTA